ncbi:MAG TPA: SDR family oxidoreductase [Dehalococcoidia bacterium]|nr:SDR family oxidoreductase [Dehalococcoidia bacterium]
MKLEGKVAIVAGGGQGIGEGIVRCLAEEGADIAIADINGETARKVAGEVKSMGRKALPIVADLTDENQVTKTVRDTMDFFGKIDILVNNVGGSLDERRKVFREYASSLSDDALPSYMHFGPEVWDRYYQLNLKSHVLMSHAVTPHLIKQRSGKIVNISSVAARMGGPEHMPYHAFKAGDISITWSLARALAPYNVTVNCVCPGHVFTPLWERSATAMLEGLRNARAQGLPLPPRFQSATAGESDLDEITPYEFWMKYTIIPSTPLGRDQTAEDMGRAVVFFVSEDARNITGQTIHVDGGIAMR